MKKVIDALKYNVAALKQKLSSTEFPITTLNWEGIGSVKKQIDYAFNGFTPKISDNNNASQSLDILI